MSVATPTVLPRPPIFPTLMPRPRQPYPTPLAVPGRRAGRLMQRRDLVQEMDDLSDEEAELEDNVRQRQHHPSIHFSVPRAPRTSSTLRFLYISF